MTGQHLKADPAARPAETEETKGAATSLRIEHRPQTPGWVRWADLLTTILGSVAALCVLGLALHVCLDVLLRTLTGAPLQGTNEYVTFWWMIPLIFFGLSVAQRANEHTDLPLLYDRADATTRRHILVITNTITAVFAGLIGWFGLEYAIHQASVGEYTGATGLTVWPARFAVPLGILAFIAQLVVSTAHQQGDSATTSSTNDVE